MLFPNQTRPTLVDTLKTLEPDDLVRYGLIPEFVGRLPVLATLDELDTDALVRILVEPKNAYTKQYSKLFEMEGVEINFEKMHCAPLRKRQWNVRLAHVGSDRFWKGSC